MKNDDIDLPEIPDIAGANSEQLNNLKLENSPSHDFYVFIIDLLKTGLVVFIIAFVLRYFVVQPYIVDGESMMPNYVNNEYLLAEKVSYLFNAPQRGDVVVFRYPKNPSVNYIKRIIGLPGETVTIDENDNIIVTNKDYPNGTIIKESYIPAGVKTNPPDNKTYSITLGNNEYFVLGDNREHSSDSREWGVLPKSNISGRSWLSIAKLGDSGFSGFQFYFKVHNRIKYIENSATNTLLSFLNSHI